MENLNPKPDAASMNLIHMYYIFTVPISVTILRLVILWHFVKGFSSLLISYLPPLVLEKCSLLHLLFPPHSAISQGEWMCTGSGSSSSIHPGTPPWEHFPPSLSLSLYNPLSLHSVIPLLRYPSTSPSCECALPSSSHSTPSSSPLFLTSFDFESQDVDRSLLWNNPIDLSLGFLEEVTEQHVPEKAEQATTN